MLLKVYDREPEVIHSNLQPLATKLPSLDAHKAMYLCQLILAVAKANPQVQVPHSFFQTTFSNCVFPPQNFFKNKKS